VQDQQATRDGILDALRKLVSESQPGDVVVIHYSGHGDRLTDDNADELDGLDELLVPVDAPYDTAGIRSGSYRGERHIRDDDRVMTTGQAQTRVADEEVGGTSHRFLVHKMPWRSPDGQVLGVIGLATELGAATSN
jgi:hypothetical protein